MPKKSSPYWEALPFEGICKWQPIVFSFIKIFSISKCVFPESIDISIVCMEIIGTKKLIVSNYNVLSENDFITVR